MCLEVAVRNTLFANTMRVRFALRKTFFPNWLLTTRTFTITGGVVTFLTIRARWNTYWSWVKYRFSTITKFWVSTVTKL